MRSFKTERNGVGIGGIDFGGRGPNVVLLHGLAGYAGEWEETASWLTDTARVVAIDARGHGESERRPDDVSLNARALDVRRVIEVLRLEPAVVVGQSIGGQTAITVACESPELVSALVAVEADPDEASPEQVRRTIAWLRSWPVPFRTRREADRFFQMSGLAAGPWTGGLEEREGELWPRFEAQVLARMLEEAASGPLWEQWRRIRCPALLVRSDDGDVPDETSRRMTDEGFDARSVEIKAGGHDLHLIKPRQWREALERFLHTLTAG